MGEARKLLQVRLNKGFRVSCDADRAGCFRALTDSLVIHIGQEIQRNGKEEMWESVSVLCQEEDDGSLSVRVLVFNPDWDEGLQIACVRSWPCSDSANLTPLGCNLDHVTL
jgi:hypothetical protein